MHINDDTGEIKLDRPYSGPPLDSAAITPLTSLAHVGSTDGKEDTGGGAGGGVAFTAEELVTEAGRMGVLRRLVAAKMLCETMACIGEVEAKEKSIKGPEGAGTIEQTVYCVRLFHPSSAPRIRSNSNPTILINRPLHCSLSTPHFCSSHPPSSPSYSSSSFSLRRPYVDEHLYNIQCSEIFTLIK